MNGYEIPAGSLLVHHAAGEKWVAPMMIDTLLEKLGARRTEYVVTPYSEKYGCFHPQTFDFDRHGRQVAATPVGHHALAASTSPVSQWLKLRKGAVGQISSSDAQFLLEQEILTLPEVQQLVALGRIGASTLQQPADRPEVIAQSPAAVNPSAWEGRARSQPVCGRLPVSVLHGLRAGGPDGLRAQFQTSTCPLGHGTCA